MSITCKNCGAQIKDGADICPNCGSSSNQFVDYTKVKPKTIKELKQWYGAMNLPPEEVTRFFIGKNYKAAKAFGIYEKEPGYFVVYKNKANGKRAIRYEGKDQEHAVNELYLKLKEEIQNQKNNNIIPGYTDGGRNNSNSNNSGIKSGNTYRNSNIKAYRSGNATSLKKLGFQASGLSIYCFAIVLFIIVAVYAAFTISMHTGYYQLENGTYYYYDETNTWFLYYEDKDDWYRSSKPDVDDVWDYKTDAESFESSWSGSTIESSADYLYEYEEYHSNDSDDSGSSWNDSSSSWDDSSSSWDSSDSWDSSTTDWDSDW